MPAPFYLDYIEEALGLLDRERARNAVDGYDEYHPGIADAIDYLNALFARRRIHYRFTAEGRAEWHGDEGVFEEVIAPALAALANPRLAACLSEFEAALGHLRAGTPKDHEDAIEEAGKAVESAMKVLLAEKEVVRAGNETAQPLWNLLRDNGIVPPKTQDAILGASRLRNEYGGHGAGEQIREIPAGISALAVQSAATAIHYLAQRL